MQNNLYDNRAPVEQARKKLHDLLISFRKDGLRLDNPQASALFETSAEVLAGLERAFEHYTTRSEAAWQK